MASPESPSAVAGFDRAVTAPPVRRLPLVLLLALAACTSDGPADDPAVHVPASPVADSSTAVDESASDSLTVVFFGDSLTAGYGLDGGASEAYPALVGARLAEAGLAARVVNAGVSGETSAGGRTRVGWVVRRSLPDVFVLALGANDGLRGVDPAATEANLAAIFEAVAEAAPDARLVLLGMEALPNYGADYTSRFRAIFPSVADAAGAALVPFFLDGVAGVRALNQPDGVHPTAEGQRRIADTVAPAVLAAAREAASEA